MVLRGINKQTIFEDAEDNEMFLLTLDQYKQKSGYKLLAYCLMGNHVHLLMKTEDDSLGQCFKRIGASYVYWYNMKYYRIGHLFQDRYKSEVVETDGFLRTVIRYIHWNPLKAGIVKSLEDYTWSSYREHLGLSEGSEGQHVDSDFVLKLFHEDRVQAIADFKAFNEIETDDRCMDISQNKRMSDEKAIRMIKKKFSVNSSKDVADFELEKKQVSVRFLLDEGMSVLQISRVTGISRYYSTSISF